MDTRIKLRVQGLTNSQIQSGAYALVLAEEDGMRRIPIIVGTSEAQSIAIALEKITPPRPLTHDLFAAFSHAFNILLREVFIYKFEDGVFYSELLFDDGERQIKIDSRTSDAIAIALRVKCDIYTTEEIVSECGVVLEEASMIQEEEVEDEDDAMDNDDDDDLPLELEGDDLKDEVKVKKWMALMDKEELKLRMEESIADESYELAKKFKDELHLREEEENKE